MNITRFDELRDEIAEKRIAIVMAKRPEYTEGNIDVLNNFKVVARESGTTPLQVWYVYFRKHIASIGQFCKNPALKMSEPIGGRTNDAMNYLELHAALMEEYEQGFLMEFYPHGPAVK